MRYHIVLSTLLAAFLLQACNAGPEATRPSAPTSSANLSAADNHISAEDQKYAKALQALSMRDPQQEAQQALANGERVLLGYYSGRAGLKTPGLSADQQTSQRCKINTVDGLGDVIYGENHLKYRIAMRNFAKAFNTQMLSVCL
ncbi:hypothetical protein [Leucothrix pacifica]|uniref:Uncharacterized protein n=1 Tax=Leucothrix pacifica TaxID=1247513 RepID=A0A317CQ13_9GAMM|nr:hypothetical protein [Leucothrix pacifica]PWR00182.1 hypothetical protein DKW60_03320 [Leucothrix pacifica]